MGRRERRLLRTLQGLFSIKDVSAASVNLSPLASRRRLTYCGYQVLMNIAETSRVYEMVSYAQPGMTGWTLRCQARIALIVNAMAHVTVRR